MRQPCGCGDKELIRDIHVPSCRPSALQEPDRQQAIPKGEGVVHRALEL